jgi:EAL domain-containing protein (putative c-di-GMP-specific phosphodiesterase class I)
LQTVTNALAEVGLEVGRLELEITESVLLQDDQANFTALHELSRLAVRIAVDDFGTGFSSLAYLLRFPIDKIKIDRSFVTGLPDRRESQAIIRAVVRCAAVSASRSPPRAWKQPDNSMPCAIWAATMPKATCSAVLSRRRR